MAYKDSFVDEYPYLVYSDDPEAVGGAGGAGSDIGIPVDSTPSMLYNNTANIVEAYILSNAEGEKLIVAFGVPSDGNPVGIAPNAFVGISKDLSVYAGPIGAAQELDKVGTVTIDDIEQNIYSLSDSSVTYSIDS